ncbi:glycosyltransferase family 4 protein [Sphingomonas sp. IC081]|uniref:glycosyltransferase family 4 protein n=1 Tax=Sphingomonas sp. IC081 TaxID=304378 RepID=UPI00115785E0|nr:glycosyltransferase family 1 protein [Sphingomonas sp. IC081]QDK34849.1 glycosyl transferase family 1 [Sphingomonas sp. IC081]
MTASTRTILIDGYNLSLQKGTGVATYARNLSKEIGRIGHEVAVLYGNRSNMSPDPLLREVSFFDTDAQRHPGTWGNALEQCLYALRGPLGQTARAVPTTGKVVTRTFASRLPHYDRVFNAPDVFRRAQSAFKLWGKLSAIKPPEMPDLAHWTYPMPLRLAGRPNIYTLHDMVPLRLPYTTLDDKRAYLRLIRKLDRSADHFVTVSECSRRDLVEVAGIAPERITNTYQSVDIPAALRDKPEDQVAREVEGFADLGYRDYLLFWGSIEPKKNIGRLLEAYLASQVDVPLLVIGAQAWKSDQELQVLNQKGKLGEKARKRVVQLPYVPFPMLITLIRGARGVLFPSLYEGFGLPALEAMLLGTPVLCSDTASLPEIAGDAALMVDPYDTAAICQGIRTLCADADLRAELSRRGLIQARKFAPEAYRARLDELYRRFL